MKCLKLEYADAFLLGPGAHNPAQLPSWLTDRTWDLVGVTAAGNRVVMPIPCPVPVLSGNYQWPVLPLVRHRGGYFTATAKYCLESGWPVVDSVTGEWVRHVFAPLPRTGHRVFTTDRNMARLVVDVIKRPKPGRPVIRKYIPVVTGVDEAVGDYMVSITKDPHLEVAQLLFGKACPKCGSQELKPRWGDATLQHCRMSRMCQRKSYCDPLRYNHIHVTCQVCHYEWLEEPLDAAETA